jgi:plastocyanin
LLALILAAAAPASVEVRLSSFAFAPETIRLRAGTPVVLRLVNTGSGGHNFAAREFFAAARDVAAPVSDGAVEVPEQGSVDVSLTPARGHYRLRCTHTLHSAFGMRGEIIVE